MALQYPICKYNPIMRRASQLLSTSVSYTHLDVYKRQESNGYDRTIVSKLLLKTQNKQQTKTENNKFITLTYINKQTEEIAHKFKKAGYRIAYKTTNKTEHALSKHKINSIYPVFTS